MKNKKILIIIITVIVIALTLLTYFTFFNKKDTLDNIGHIFTLNEDANIDTGINYIEKYKDNIINEKVTSYDYEILLNNGSLYGKIYIDSEGYLNITDDFNRSTKRINDEKYNLIYRNINYTDKMIIYALSSNNKLYKIVLNTIDIKEVKYYELQLKSEFTSFTNLNVNTVASKEINPVILCSDNKMYVADYGILYNTNYYVFYDNYIVFEDNTIALTNGKLLKNAFDENVKASAYIIFDEKVFDTNPVVGFVTDRGELLFKYSNNEVYLYNKLIKYMDGYETIKLSFYDDTTLSFKGAFYIMSSNTED